MKFFHLNILSQDDCQELSLDIYKNCTNRITSCEVSFIDGLLVGCRNSPRDYLRIRYICGKIKIIFLNDIFF